MTDEEAGALSRQPAARVFITGASGFIGRTLAERYRRLGSRVAGVDRAAHEAAGAVAGDVASAGAWQLEMQGCDLVIPTAAVVSNVASLEESWKLNVMGTRRALHGAAAAGVKRFVHISSVRAFSDLDYPDRVDEHHPFRPDGNPHVDTKAASEQVALQAHAAGEVPVTVIRPGDVYGPGSRPWTILPVEAIKANQFVLPAMGRGIFSPVYVQNLVDGMLLATGHPAAARCSRSATGSASPARSFSATTTACSANADRCACPPRSQSRSARLQAHPHVCAAGQRGGRRHGPLLRPVRHLLDPESPLDPRIRAED